MAQRRTQLTDNELRAFRRTLEDKRRQLVQDFRQLAQEVEEQADPKSSAVISSAPTHMADIGTRSYDQEKEWGLLESQRELLREVDDALARLDAGVYGVCEGTGQLIGRKRLKAKPWARYSLEHERRMEGR